MSQEWNPQDLPSQNPTPNTTGTQTTTHVTNVKPQKNFTVVYIVIIAILLGVCVWLFSTRGTLKTENKNLLTAKDSVQVVNDTLQTEYQAALGRLDALTTSNTGLQKEISDKDGELQKLHGQLDAIMAKSNRSAADNKRAKDLIAQLNTKVRSYEERITELEGQNKDLTNQNSNLAQQRDSTVNENTKIKKLGSVLHASNIRMMPIHLKHGGTKEDETTKAKKTDLMRIYFDIDENRIAESGDKEIFIRITDPSGALLSNAAYGSGVTTNSDGQSIGYTLQKSIALQREQPVKDVTVDWKQNADYQKGTYNIEIYNEGYKVGGGSVTLK